MCTRIIKIMIIKDGHTSALESEGIQDDIMDEDDKTESRTRRILSSR
jgi:hypothetical protein